MRPLVLLFLLSLAALPAGAERVKRAKDAPPEVQMLVPGFEVKELPVQLTNAVNLQYRHDGKLVVLGYNGDIHLLTDSDGDGLEDHAQLFWDGSSKVSAPIGMDLAPKGSVHGDAVFFACKGKVMMVTDRDGDGVAEEDRVIAEGWPLALAGVDTASVCFDPRDGSVYFGLGVRLYNNAYELDERGVAHNDLSSERGAILRIAPDFKSREKLCTGVRWPIGLRFNAAGDLFCTDQEGATWLPNGNPFDELLLIERGRHYGFPPRHPRHLPNVVDEPSVFDYGPQHQSTCGLRFNEGVNGGPHFGPSWWKGDALIAAESRGKIYRTKLIKTAHGYVAHNQIIACLNQLTVDVTVSPRGDLLVATHSGEPDWGTGPKGMGRLFCIRYADREAMQPRLVWSDSPEEFRIAFERPAPANIGLRPEIRRGLYVRAGDDYETMWPGYEVIKLQHSAPVTTVKDEEGTWTPDRHTLKMRVAPQSIAEHYSFKAMPHIHLDGELTGIEAVWKGEDGQTRRQVLPHLETGVNEALLGDHLSGPTGKGELTLRTRLDLWRMLRPAVQPGASLDYEVQPEEVTVWIASADAAFEVVHGGKTTASQLGQVTHDVFITLTPQRHQPMDVRISCRAEAMPDFQIAYHTREDIRPRAMPLRRFLLPWARPELTPGLAVPLPRPEIAGGDWQRGRQLFFSEKTLCSKCHQVRGTGGKIGPDLSNLTSRSHASVLKDLRDPNAALNPDYIAHEVKLKDGRQFLAVLREAEEGRVVLGIGAGAEITVMKDDIVAQEASKASLMPAQLDQVLGEHDLRDLMTYLLTEPPVMQVYNEAAKPPQRTRAEIDAVLAGAEYDEPLKPLKLLLVSGKKDHGVGEHDYPRWRTVWSRLFTLAAGVSLDLAEEWPSAEQWRSADAVVFFRKGDWSEERAKDFDGFLARGGGATFIHWSLEAGEAAPSLAKRLGLASARTQTRYRHGAIDLVFGQHAITRGFTPVTFVDEMYWNLVSSAQTPVEALATAMEAGQSHPQAWTQEPASGGRIFVTLGGHYSSNFDDPLFRILLLRGIAWTTREPVDRFNNLIEAGLEP
jgi:putative heme-binding domain-containing protein